MGFCFYKPYYCRLGVQKILVFKPHIVMSLVEAGFANCYAHVFVFLTFFFPLRRSVELNSNSLESYENIMQSSLGFVNPGVVEFLLEKLGIDESHPPSLMRGLQR